MHKSWIAAPRRVIDAFFFSSRRRHTRWNCDWSSDVCSSDLRPPLPFGNGVLGSAFAPGLGEIPFGSGRGGRTLVIGAYGAAREENPGGQQESGVRNRRGAHTRDTGAPRSSHYFFSPCADLPFVVAGTFPGGGAALLPGAPDPAFGGSFTLTCTPSSSESGGFSTIQSSGRKPCSTSSEVP